MCYYKSMLHSSCLHTDGLVKTIVSCRCCLYLTVFLNISTMLLMPVSSRHVTLTNTHGLFRAECCQICHRSVICSNSQHRLKFPNEWRDLENTQDNCVQTDDAPRLRMIDVCQIRFVCKSDHLVVFQGIPGPVGNKGPKGRQVNSPFIYKH